MTCVSSVNSISVTMASRTVGGGVAGCHKKWEKQQYWTCFHILERVKLIVKVSGQGKGVFPCMATYQEKDDSIVVVEG